jgi:hypothetical protein
MAVAPDLMTDHQPSRSTTCRETSGRRAAIIAAVIYLVAVLCMFGDVLCTGTRVLSKDGEDLADIFLHWQQFGARELRTGHLPLWNPHVYAGAPYFGSFQPALAYPPNWLGLVLPTVVAINVGIALHFFLGGLWTYLWTSRRRLHPAACTLAGLVFMFCGAHFLQLYRGHLPTLRTVIWAPLILLAVDGVVETVALKWILLGMVAVALQVLAGHIQQTFYTALVVGCYASLCWLRSAQRLRAAAGLAAIYAGGAALTAVQLLTGLDAVSESAHRRLSYAIAASFAFPPENLLTLVLPGVFGDMVSEPYWGRWTLSEMSLFIGCAPFLLALYAVIAGTRERKRFSFVLTLVVLVLAFGYYTPLFRLLYEYAPWFGSFRGTKRFTVLAALFLAMLAAVGFDLLLRARPPARWPGIVAVIAAVVLLAVGAGVLASARSGAAGLWARGLASIDLRNDAFRYYPVDRGGSFALRAGIHAARSMFIASATFLVLGCLWVGARRRRSLAYAIAILGCVELLVYARYTRPSFDAAKQLRAADRVGIFTRAIGGDARVLSDMPYLAMSAGAYDVWGDDPMVLMRYAEFIAFTQNRSPDDAGFLALRRISPLLGMLRLRYLLRVDDARIQATRTNLNEMPRARLVSQWRVIADRGQRLAAMADPDFDPRDTVLLEAEPDPPPAGAGDRGSVSLTDLSSDVIEIRAELPEPAILVISDNYSAGWKATALAESPQRAYTVMPANHTLRAIPLAAGAHHLRLEYRPRAFVVGLWITTVSVAAYMLALVWIWRHRCGERSALRAISERVG